MQRLLKKINIVKNSFLFKKSNVLNVVANFIHWMIMDSKFLFKIFISGIKINIHMILCQKLNNGTLQKLNLWEQEDF